jgi:hypothetical protein
MADRRLELRHRPDRIAEDVWRPETSASRERPIEAQAFVAVVQVGNREHAGQGPLKTLEGGQIDYQCMSSDRRMQVGVLLRHPEDRNRGVGGPIDANTLLLGSDAEWSAVSEPACMAAGVSVRIDLKRTRLEIRTSIIGLPPVFVHRTPARIVITSDLSLLKSIPGVELEFDRQGVLDFCQIGHPTGFRTLFDGVRVVPGGRLLEVNARGEIALSTAWKMPPAVPVASWREYIDLQREAFDQAMRGLDRQGAFLSLTAGLDTRTILAALLREGDTVPAASMSWKDVSLDARTAGELCRAYDIEHSVVRFDEGFAEKLPEYALAASRLSGGLASVGEATEVAFYREIGARFRTRLSGFLGNQIGRGGVEQIRDRNGNSSILGPALVEAGRRIECEPVCAAVDGDPQPASLMRFVENSLFESMGNFCIGNHFMVQESPYASRPMIEALALAPLRSMWRKTASAPRLRLRDSRHRFLGESERCSFQRTLISGVGGYVAEHPINWGWRVASGPSVRGLALGALAMLDMAAGSRAFEKSVLRRAVAALPVTGRHDFRQLRKWCSRDFLQDTLSRGPLRDSGVLDLETIRRFLSEHFAGKADHHGNLILALDLAHAHQIFVRGDC